MQHRLRFLLLLLLLLLPLLLSSPGAHAETTGGKAASEALFQAGRELMAAGKFAEACGKFEASQRLDAGLGTLLFLADCYEKANRLASAWATFREAESIAMGRNDASRAEIAKQRYSVIEPKLSKLWIKVTDGNPADIEVMRDGESVPRESWGIALPTDSGDHVIAAKAAGHKPWSTKVVVVGEASNVPVEVPLLEVAPEEPKPVVAPVVSAPPSPAADRGPTSSEGNAQRIVGIVMGSAGVVGLGLSTVLTLKAKSKNDDSKKDGHCPVDPNVCDAAGTELRKEALSAARAATAFGIAGGVLLVGGVVVYLTSPSGSKASAARPRLELGGGPTLAQVSLEGAF